MSNRLSPKQDKFVQTYLETGNASEAYRQSYSCKAMSANAVAVEANKLLKNPKIALRLSELQKVSERAFEITCEQKKRWLQDIVLDGMKQAVKFIEDENGEERQIELGMMDRKGAISAIAELNKMDGHLATIKIDAKNENINHNYAINPDASPQTAAAAYQALLNGKP